MTTPADASRAAAGDVQVERGGSARLKVLGIRGRTPGSVAAAVAAADG